MKSDDVIENYSSKKSDLSLKLLPGDEDGEPMILIEGSPRALHLLAELLVAVADDKDDDGFGLGPRSAGSKYFSKESEFGVYIHRLDKP